MKKTGMKVAAFAAAALMGTMAFAGCNAGGDKDKYVYLGASGPLTGGAALYGVAVRNGAQLAVDEINAAGGLSNKVKFKFNMLDDEHNKDKAASNYSSLYDWGMQFSLGCVTSTPCLEFKEYAKNDKLFFLTPSATNDDVIKNYDGAYQMCFSDSGQGTGAALLVEELYPSDDSTIFAGAKLGALYKSDDAYSSGLFNNFWAEFSAEQKAAINVQTFTGATSTDFSTQANALKDCDFIFMPFYYEEASTFMAQAKGIVKNDAIYFGCDGFDGIDQQEGFDISTIPQEVSYLSHFNSGATEGVAGDFVRNYTAKYGATTLNQFGASAYDCVYALKDALNKAMKDDKELNVDGNLSVKQMSDILKGVFQSSDFSFSGVTGTDVTWGNDGSVSKSAVKYIVKNKS